MAHLNRLRCIMMEHDVTPVLLAKKLDLSRAAVYRRLNGQVAFTLREIRILIRILSLSMEDVHYIFFG